MQEIVEVAYEHEIKVTESITNIAIACEKAKDCITRNFLNWFLEEQIEEESTLDEILDKIEEAKGDIAVINMIEWGMPYRSEVINKIG